MRKHKIEVNNCPTVSVIFFLNSNFNLRMPQIQTNNVCSINISPNLIDHRPCINSLKHSIVQVLNVNIKFV